MARNREIDQGHIEEGTLHAWLDGALAPEESARVETHVNACAACGAAAAEARGLVAAASRMLTALDDVPGGVAPGGQKAGGRIRASTERGRRLWSGWPIRAAAAVLFVAAGSLAVVRELGDSRNGYGVAPSKRELVTPIAPATTPPPRAFPSVVPAPPAAKKQQPPTPRKRDIGAEAAAPLAEQKVAREAAPQVTAPATASAPPPAAAAAQESRALADSTGTAPRAQGPVVIAGRVVDANTGAPVQQALVHLSEPSVTAATNATGDYVIPVPAGRASGQPAQLTVRRIGFQSKVDSLRIARDSLADTVRHDVAIAPYTGALSQVVVTGGGNRTETDAVAKARRPAPSAAPAAGLQGGVPSRTPAAPGCYAITAPGLPSRIEIGDRLRVLPPDSAAFPTAYWSSLGPTRVRIVFVQTSGTMYEVKATVLSQGLSGSVTRSDSSSVVTPFFAMRTATHCP